MDIRLSSKYEDLFHDLIKAYGIVPTLNSVRQVALKLAKSTKGDEKARLEKFASALDTLVQGT